MLWTSIRWIKAIVEKEREILRQAALAEGKPENIVDKMVEGRLRNFYAERCLMEQPFVKDDKQTVGDYAKAAEMKVKRLLALGDRRESRTDPSTSGIESTASSVPSDR